MTQREQFESVEPADGFSPAAGDRMPRMPAGTLTEFLTVKQIADYFRIGRKRAAQKIEETKGHKRDGRFVQFPVEAMPSTYWADLESRYPRDL
jgi:hypothetical protein